MTQVISTRAKAEAGFNLIEAAIVLGIVGLIVGGIWAAAGSAYENMRQQRASKSILSMAQAMRNFYANSGVAQVETNATNLISMGVVPADMIAAGNTAIRDPWGRDITVASTSGSGRFMITFQPLTIPQCKALISRNANAASGTDMTAHLSATSAALTTDEIANPACTVASTPSFSFNIQ